MDSKYILQQLSTLEKDARVLEPQAQERRELRREVIAYSEDFLENIPNRKTYQITEDKGRNLYKLQIEEKGKNIADILQVFGKEVDQTGLNPASGGHLAYIPGGGIYPSALGDYLADISNRFAGVFYSSPGAVRLENQVLRWLNDIFGFPQTAGGTLTSGGSIANMTAIVTAREQLGLRARDYHRAVVYCTSQVHHCVDKALKIAGLEEAIKRHIPFDAQFKMCTKQLDQQIQADKEAGLQPFIVIASAGTTNTGTVDPLEAIGLVTQKHKIWYHIDAAYGGFFKLCPETRDLFRGTELADSIVVDPHKGLFLPYGLGAVIVKNMRHLYDSFHMEAPYLQDCFEDMEEISPADVSAELSRPFRGLRLWLPLQLMGVQAFRSALSEKIWLCRYFYEKVQQLGFEVAAYPELSVMMFRYCPKGKDADAFNLQIIEEIKKDGRVFLSSTHIEGKVYLRLAVLSFRTHLEQIQLCLEVLEEIITKLTV